MNILKGIDIKMNEETKICTKCGRELPIDRFQLMKPKKWKPYYLNTCKDCRYKYRRELLEKEREVKLLDDIEILVHRSYKHIAPQRILDISGIGIEPIAADEIFVKLLEYQDFWLSNYGRGIHLYNNKYNLLNGSYDEQGSLRYSAKKNVLCEYKWIYIKTELYVAHAVVKEFIVNPDTVNNVFVWHKGEDKNDYYYKHLYPLNKDQYYAVRRYYREHGDDSEETIVNIMNNIRYKPDDWSARKMQPTVCGRGYHGREGIDCDSKAYLRWTDMMHRCYDEKVHKRSPEYKDCTVCEEWLNFCNFEKWYNENYYEVEGDRMDLDKDILIKGNKEYCPAACSIIPHAINALFISMKKESRDLPVGVYYDNDKKKYRACMSYMEKRMKLGEFNNAEKAFHKYKAYKEEFIKNMAMRYKEKIPGKVYNAMMDWKVEIDD